MAGCGIRALRYGLEGRAQEVWANDADGDRLPLLTQNLQPLQKRRLELSVRTAQHLLADCLMQQRRFDLLDLDVFGCPTALVPLALEALEFGGVLYLASTVAAPPLAMTDRRRSAPWGPPPGPTLQLGVGPAPAARRGGQGGLGDGARDSASLLV